MADDTAGNTANNSADDERAGPAGTGPAGTGAAPKRGSDLAREALAAARKKNAARRRTAGRPGVTGGTATRLSRRRWSAAGPDSRDPQAFGEVLKKVVKQSGSSAEITRANLFARWPEIVGSKIAEHCTPIALTDRHLSLQCESTAWASQIRLMAPQLLRTINEAIGHGSVVRIKATGPAAPSWRFGPRHISGRGPRDTYG